MSTTIVTRLHEISLILIEEFPWYRIIAQWSRISETCR